VPLIGAYGKYDWPGLGWLRYVQSIKLADHKNRYQPKETTMKTWMKPSVREQEVGLEVTSYLPAEIDLI
jgi:coenzyme PQQ precursor peptide PqqA